MSKKILLAVMVILLLGWFKGGSLAAVKMVSNISDGEIPKPTQTVDSDNADEQEIRAKFLKAPLSFIENRGQLPEAIACYHKGPAQSIYCTKENILFKISRIKQDASRKVNGLKSTNRVEHLLFSLTPLGANNGVRLETEDKLDGVVNYFIGKDPQGWKTGVATYRSAVYRDLYDGIDLKVYGNGEVMEYDFIVSPGADFTKIKMAYEGIEGYEINENGDLVIKTRFGAVRQKAPYIYQEVEGKRVEVTGGFALEDEESGCVYSFQVAAYDRNLPLIIDPELLYAVLLGGTEGGNQGGDYWPEFCRSIEVDGGGNAYVSGQTDSDTDFPSTSQSDYAGGDLDMFVVKLSSTGSIVYSTFIGGRGRDENFDMAVDGSGSVYVTGMTGSDDYPIVPEEDAIQENYGSARDAVVTKLSSSGGSISYSTYLGGGRGGGGIDGRDGGYGIAVDGGGNAYVTGFTESTAPFVSGFPLKDPLDEETYGGSTGPIFITKIDAPGRNLVYSTRIRGGTSYAIDIDGSGCAYITGDAYDIPTVNAVMEQSGLDDAFITKLNANGQSIAYSTFLGGSGSEVAYDIAVDAAGSAYITGFTGSNDFPVAPQANPLQGSGASAGFNDAFITKLSPGGGSILYSTYLGGSDADVGRSIAVDGGGRAYITGETWSSDFPVLDAFQATPGGGGTNNDDAFVAMLNFAGTALMYSSYLGGEAGESGYGIAVDRGGCAYVAGHARASLAFPTDDSFQGNEDGFVVRVDRSSGAQSSEQSVVQINAIESSISEFPAPLNVPIVFTTQATSEEGETLYYKYFVIPNYCSDAFDTTYSAVREYSLDNSFTWTPTEEGSYVVVVWVVQRTYDLCPSVARLTFGVYSKGTLELEVKHAITGLPLSGATVELGGLTATTGAGGTVTLPGLAAGSYQVEVSRGGFITTTQSVSVPSDDTVSRTIALSPVLPAGSTRIVLTWGAEPLDLDAHLTGPGASGGRFHVYKSSRNPAGAGANLNVDGSAGFGPETITITEQRGGTYKCYVHDFTNRENSISTALAYSEALVEVYQGNTMVAAFDVPLSAGNAWYVFDMNGATGEITEINTVGSGETAPPYVPTSAIISADRGSAPLAQLIDQEDLPQVCQDNPGYCLRGFEAPDTDTKGLAWDGRYMWVCEGNYASSVIFKVDVVTGEVAVDSDTNEWEYFFSPGPNPYGLAFDGEYLWCLDQTDHKIYKIDPETEAVVDSIPTPTEDPEDFYTGLAWDGSAFWVAGYSMTYDQDNARYEVSNSAVYQMGSITLTGTATVALTVPLGEDDPMPLGLAHDGDNLWISTYDSDEILRLDLGTGEIAASGEPSPVSGACGMTWDGFNLWVASWYSRNVFQVDVFGAGDFADAEEVFQRVCISDMTSNASIPHTANSLTTFTVEAYGQAPTLYYRFIVSGGYCSSGFGETWQVIRDYAPSNSVSWRPPAEDGYVVRALVTDDTSSACQARADISVVVGNGGAGGAGAGSPGGGN